MKRCVLLVVLALVCTVFAQNPPAPGAKPTAAAPTPAPAAKPKPAAPNLAKQPTLYVVGYAHLDTQWRWDYPTTIREYLTKTMRLNFDWFEKYPHYVFNFSGANRYRMMKEYYPADYEKLKKYVATGRWFPAGSSMEENDVNSPSAESIIRQILYGKEYFRRDFGKTSAEFMLPDCFGFPASLPSILAHAGIKGFSTQKLTWQSAAQVGGPDSPEKTPAGIPFNVGIWEGLDGKGVIAALNPGGYGNQITYDLSKTPHAVETTDAWQQRHPPEDWVSRIKRNGDLTSVYADYMYYGTGDTGGSADESSIKLMEAIATAGKTVLPQEPAGQKTADPVVVGNGPVKVISATSDQMFLDIKPEQMAKFPRYKGDLELINHSAGSITSQAYMKRWNRMNEVLADDAERASVAAELLGGRAYPLKRLNDAWTLVMGAQFHDIIPGTSLPKAYEYSWNDEVLAMNQFASVLTDATEAVASGLNTQTTGTAIVVYNPLNIAREDVVEAHIAFPEGVPKAVRVVGPDGRAVPAQIDGEKDGAATVIFVAKVPSVGFAVYDVQPAETPAESELKVTEKSLENARYRISLNQDGDIGSIFDRAAKKELLSAPMRLAISTDNPAQWPAWNMDFEDEQRAPRAYVAGPATMRVVENGPARVAVEVAREAEGSRFVQTIRLAAGEAGNRVEFANAIDWLTKDANLKAAFPLTVSNPMATYNWDIGTLQRPTENERQFEVASHQWVDLTDKDGSYGVTILTDAKNASDKPDDHTLRLTLVRTPGTRAGWPLDQGSQDLGHHEFVFGLAGHAGDYRDAAADWEAWRLNQPLVAFESQKHAGALGKSFSLLEVSNRRVRVLAVKRAEQSTEVVVRMVELDGKAAPDVSVKFAAPIVAAREINGAEEPAGTATVKNGGLMTSFSAFQPRTFALKLGAAPAKVAVVKSQPVNLPYDMSVATPDGKFTFGAFDEDGRALPAEMLPTDLAYGGIHFRLASTGYQKANAVVARGQTVNLPAGFNRVYVLAAAADSEDQPATFRVGEKPVALIIQPWTGFIGQWDVRQWKKMPAPPPTQEEQDGIARRRAQLEAARRASGEITPLPPMPPRPPVEVFDGLIPGFIKPAPVAWFASHLHNANGTNEPYAYSYLFAYPIEVPPGAKSLALPVNDRIRILAVTAAQETAIIHPAAPLYDTLQHAEAESAQARAAQ